MADDPTTRTTAETDAPVQRFGTDGIDSMVRPNRTARFFMRIVRGVERMNLRYARHGNPPVYDSTTFSWAAGVGEEWRAIRTELATVLKRKDDLPGFHEIATDVATISTDRDWKTFMLVGFGIPAQRNIELCPETWRILQKIPGLKTAMFSIFEPGKHLKPHRGPYNGVLRLHLGLIVPDSNPDKVGIRVANEIRGWADGEVLIFDDAYEHEAWNFSDQVRVVLFVDFVKPLRFPGNLLNWLLMNLAVFTPFIREGQDAHKAWEKRFYAQAEALRNS